MGKRNIVLHIAKERMQTKFDERKAHIEQIRSFSFRSEHDYMDIESNTSQMAGIQACMQIVDDLINENNV